MKKFLIILAFIQTLVAAYLGLIALPRGEEHLSVQISTPPSKMYYVSQVYRFDSGHEVGRLTPGFVRGYLLAKEGIDVSISTSHAKGKWTLESDDPVPISVSDRTLSNASFSFLKEYYEQQEQD